MNRNESRQISPETPTSQSNTENLLRRAWQPAQPREGFLEQLTEQMQHRAGRNAQAAPTGSNPTRRTRRLGPVLRWGSLAAAAAVLIAATVFYAYNADRQTTLPDGPGVVAQSPDPGSGDPAADETRAEMQPYLVDARLTPRPAPQAKAAKPLVVGAEIVTGPGESRRTRLPDGSVLYVNQASRVRVLAQRKIRVDVGEVYVEVVPAERAGGEPFVLAAPDRTVTAVGTKFAVRVADGQTAAVQVAEGAVRVSGYDQLLHAGRQLDGATGNSRAMPRASAVLDWTRRLRKIASGALVPESEYAGGALVAVDPNGQEVRLELRKIHVDVHIEDGFARTTIDQTYFNRMTWRLEGTFYFPLPPDASLSRLAMYVAGKRMEGGMCERARARQVYEEIVYQRRDPALLEWLDGTTFKMRVFPLEPRQEKRIILSYTQALGVDYDKTRYAFPGGHSMQNVGQWSFRARVKDAADLPWVSRTMDMDARNVDGDLVLTASARDVAPDRDIDIAIGDLPSVPQEVAAFRSCDHQGHRYFLVRFRPELPDTPAARKRHWVVVFESSADRDPMLARAQIEILRQVLGEAGDKDTFQLIAAATSAAPWKQQPVAATQENIEAAAAWLGKTHLVGALDLEQALAAASELARNQPNAHILHLGSGRAVLGNRKPTELAEALPADMPYVGVAVGKQWDRAFMKAAAGRTGGYYTQINPDENIGWRSFQLVSTLNTPRLLNIAVTDASGTKLMTLEDSIADGQEVVAVTRYAQDAPLPAAVTVKGRLAGKAFAAELPVENVAPQAAYLPRTWARRRIDQLLAVDPEANKAEIIAISKKMYVMSPFTSLLVLENEQMYQQYGVDRGRSDHWAIYPAPDEIEVVHEPLEAVRPARAVPADPKDDRKWIAEALAELQVKYAQPLVWGEYRGQHNFTQVLNYGSHTAWQVASGQVWPSPQHWYRGVVTDGGFSYAYDPWTGAATTTDGRVFQASPPVQSSYLTGWRWFQSSETMFQPLGGKPGPIRGRLSLREAQLGQQGQSLGAVPPMVRRSGRRIADLGEPGPQGWLGPDSLDGDVRGMRGSLETRFGRRKIRLSEVAGDVLADPPARFTRWNGLPRVEALNLKQRLGVEPSNKLIPWYDELRFPSDWKELSALQQDDRNLRAFASQDNRQNLLALQRKQRDLEFDGVQLDRVLRFFREVAGVEMQVHWSALGQIGIDRDTEVRAHLQNVSTAAGLDQILRQVSRGRQGRATFTIHGGQVVVSSDRDLVHRFGQGYWTPDAWILRAAAQHVPTYSGGRYSRPTFSGWHAWLSDLTLYAPALQTTPTDMAAWLENYKPDHPSLQTGKIDPAAAKRIAGARRGPWRRLIGPDGKASESQLVFDPAGQFRMRRTLWSGLEERIAAESGHLIHAYPELGLAARRQYARAHRRQWAGLLPWVLPAAEDLAVGYRIEAVDADTIRRVPLDAGRTGSDGKAIPYAVEVIDFAADGSLARRSWVLLPDEETLRVQTFGPDGRITWADGDGEIYAELEARLQPADAPTPLDTAELVVLPLPIVSRRVAAERFGTGELDEMSQEQLLGWVATLVLPTPSSPDVQNFGSTGNVHDRDILRRFTQAGDHRKGLYALLGATHIGWRDTYGPDDTPLNRYMKGFNSPGLPDLDELDLPEGSFLAGHAAFRRVMLGWQELVNSYNKPDDRQAWLAEAEAFVRSDAPMVFRWAVLNQMPRAGLTGDAMAEMRELYDLFAANPQLAYAARYERARYLQSAGKIEAASTAYRRLWEMAVTGGVVPPIDHSFVHHFGQAGFHRLVKQTARDLGKDKQYLSLIRLALLCRDLSRPVGKVAIETLLDAEVPQTLKTYFRGVAFRYYQTAGDWSEALAQVEQILDQTPGQAGSWLLRQASRVAGNAGRPDKAIEYLEAALHADYDNWGGKVNLQAIRGDFNRLLSHYQSLAGQIAAGQADQIDPDQLAGKIVRLADRWRHLDPDDTAACNLAAEALRRLGRTEMAWAYLTTPVAKKPDESGAWLNLGNNLAGQDAAVLAVKAYDAAFRAETTNPEPLFRMGQQLEQLERFDRAREVYARAATGDWHWRFDTWKNQARQRLEQLPANPDKLPD